MEYTSSGRLQLVAISEEIGGYTAVARKLSARFKSPVHHTTVRGWAVGSRRPELAFAAALEDEFRIPARAWLEPAEGGSGGAVEHPGSDGVERVQFTELDEEIHDSEDSLAGGAT